MTRAIIATITTALQDLPDGMAAGQFEVTLSTAGAADLVQAVDTTVVTFTDLAPGDYTVSACRLAATGERISAPVAASITVPAPVQVDVPALLTLTIG